MATATATASPTATPSPTATATSTVTATATSTPTATTTEPRSCRSLARSEVRSSATPCDYPVLDDFLSELVCNYEAVRRSGSSWDGTWPTLIRVVGSPQLVVDFLARNGVEYDTHKPHRIRGGVTDWVLVRSMPISLMVRVSQIRGVRSLEWDRIGSSDESFSLVEEPDPLQQIVPTQVTSSLTTHAAAMHGADAWHDAGIDAAGVKIGFIDGGFKDFSAFRGENLDIPATVTAQCYLGDPSTDLPDGFSEHCEASNYHGTEVAMAVMDVAPGAELFLALSKDRQSVVREAADWMIEQGVNLINLSVSFDWEAGGYGVSVSDSGVLRAMEDAVAAGAVWINSAAIGRTRTGTISCFCREDRLRTAIGTTIG